MKLEREDFIIIKYESILWLKLKSNKIDHHKLYKLLDYLLLVDSLNIRKWT